MSENIDIAKLRDIELKMLLCVDSISMQLGIQYFLIGGSLLGAVRHKGFIPWDDDIDIGMLRTDYEKFICKANELLPSYYFLQTNETDPEYYQPYAKLRDSRTTFIEKSSAKHKINHGVYIDIFPIDFYKKDSILKKIKRLLLTTRILREYKINVKNRNIKSKVISLVSSFVNPNVRKTIKTLNKINSQYKNGNLRINYCGVWGDKEIVPADIFDNSKLYEFEGLYFSGIENYDSYLKKIYGDYMQLPPPEKRISHHYTEKIDLEKPYTFYENHPLK